MAGASLGEPAANGSAAPHCPGSSVDPRFEAFYQSFEAAVVAAGSEIDRYFRVAGHDLRFRFAGPALVGAMTPAFAHLVVEPCSSPALTICLWDIASTGVGFPRGIGPIDQYLESALPSASPEGAFRAAYGGPDSGLSMLDLSSDVALLAAPDAATVPFYDAAGPVRNILNWWMSARGLQFLHAAAVGTREGGALIVGRSGSGKSTTALACLEAGLSYVGDDHCIVTLDPEPFAHSVYSSGKVSAHNMHRLPGLEPLVSNPDRLATEKAVFWLNDIHPDRVLAGFPVRALLIPTNKGRKEPVLHRTTAAAGLAVLAPSTLLQMPTARAESLRLMARLVASVPCFEIELSEDPSLVAELLRHLLAGDIPSRARADG